MAPHVELGILDPGRPPEGRCVRIELAPQARRRVEPIANVGAQVVEREAVRTGSELDHLAGMTRYDRALEGED